jgi:hypothetical protein
VAGPQVAHRDCAIREAHDWGDREDARASNDRPISNSGWGTHRGRAKRVKSLRGISPASSAAW